MKQYKTTHEDLADELERRNTHGKFTNTIRAARDKYFHDFKSPHPNPKAECVRQLNVYGSELGDLVQAVMNGEYDEPPDRKDLLHLRQALMRDGHDDNSPLLNEMGLTLKQINERRPE